MKAASFLIIFSSLLFIMSCEDIIEKDINKKNITVLAPQDGLVTSSLTTTFWWEELEGAEEYRLQVVKGTFSNVTQLIFDTTISFNRFDYNFTAPGSYQWRVKGLNNGSETIYTAARTLLIDSTADLSSQTLFLLSPDNNLSTSNGTVNFIWQSISTATDYHFQILDAGTTALLFDTTITGTSIALTSNEGNYTWRVRAENNNSVTQYTSRSLVIDITPPSVPVATEPANTDTISAPANFEWAHDATTFSDSLYIYTDSLVTPYLKTSVTGTTFSIISIANGKYYWQLKSFDSAGNASSISDAKYFYVQ